MFSLSFSCNFAVSIKTSDTRKLKTMTELTIQHRRNAQLVATLYNRYANDLRRYLCSILHNMEDAEDLMHDLFIKVLNVDLITESSARSWLFIMARNMVTDLQRHRAYVRQREADLSKTLSGMHDDATTKRVEYADLLMFEQRWLSRLPTKRARIYRMYRHEEMTADEIAAELHLSKRTVECQIYLSTKKIKYCLKHII